MGVNMKKENNPPLDLLIRDSQESPKEYRVCAICLCDVERVKYDEHMQQAHGYKTIHLTVRLPNE
jgi:hypothetical protein